MSTLVLVISPFSDRTPRNLTLAISIGASGAYTLLLYLARRAWLPLLAKRPVAGATALDIFNAALVEALFLAVQTALGAEGVAAHENLFVDWLLTMPWYAGRVWIFVRVRRRERWSAAAVRLWGAIYEAGADGLVGGLIVPTILGSPPVLAPAWVLEAAAGGCIEPVVSRPARFAPGLKPFTRLAISTVYLLGVLAVMWFLNGG